jgi:hypothetical protein
MNLELLRVRARECEALAAHYAEFDKEAADFYAMVKPYLQRAVEGTLTEPLPMRELSGRAYFEEGNLGKYRDLSAAFSCFYVEAIGGDDNPVIELLREYDADRK